jgi:sugar phosphate isomerase/epimerase
MGFRFAGFADEAGRTIEEQIAATERLGWDAIEVRALEGTNFTQISDEQFDRAWETMQAHGIGIAAFGSRLANWARPITTDFAEDVAEMKAALPRMQKSGAKIIRCMSYPNDGLPEDEWKAETFRRLQELSKMAGDGGVILAHENCSGYGSLGPAEALELIEEVGSPSFKWIFDTGNPVSHGQDPWALYETVRDHIVHVHIKDAKAAPGGEAKTCYPGEGDGRVADVVADLKARRYDGYLSIEPHIAAVAHEGRDVADAKAAADIYVEYGRRIMEIADRA